MGDVRKDYRYDPAAYPSGPEEMLLNTELKKLQDSKKARENKKDKKENKTEDNKKRTSAAYPFESEAMLLNAEELER